MRLQLKKRLTGGVALFAVASAVAVTWAGTAEAEGSSLVTRASSELSGYTDTDRVTVLTPTVAGGIENPTEGWSAKGRYLVDVVSAASVDIVSTASGTWHEVRQAGSLEGAYKPKSFGVAGAGSFSSEPDYLAYAFGGNLSQDFAEKNLTLLAGYGFGHDTIGRTGTSFADFSRTLARHSFVLGATIVLGRSTVLGLGLDTVLERGDPSKTYRYVPLFSPEVAAGLERGASPGVVAALRLPARPLEQLPLARDRFALTARLAHRFARSTLRLEERVYADSWAMKASSTDLRYVIDAGPRWSFWPHARFHAQTPVSFWKRAYTLGADGSVPALRTGNRELGPLTSVTGGAGLHVALGPAQHPNAWGFGAQVDAIYTSFLDDIYITSRLATLGSVSVEAEF